MGLVGLNKSSPALLRLLEMLPIFLLKQSHNIGSDTLPPLVGLLVWYSYSHLIRGLCVKASSAWIQDSGCSGVGDAEAGGLLGIPIQSPRHDLLPPPRGTPVSNGFFCGYCYCCGYYVCFSVVVFRLRPVTPSRSAGTARADCADSLSPLSLLSLLLGLL